jgi:protein-L-isoaspartate(D-aspartate) O-methyltransferase
MTARNLRNDGFDEARGAMLEGIAAHARQCAEETGRAEISARVRAALLRAPRHLFVPETLQKVAYADAPLPIGSGKTISQPFMVAIATEVLDIEEDDKVLEIGAGLGYQAAVLAELTDHVYTVEILTELAEEAKRRLAYAGYDKVRVRTGDGARGWPEVAPIDKILISVAVKTVPKALLEQLKPGGRMIVPVGEPDAQMLQLIEKQPDGRTKERALFPVRYSTLSVTH